MYKFLMQKKGKLQANNLDLASDREALSGEIDP